MKKKTYLLIHAHKHGVSHYEFKSAMEIQATWYDCDEAKEIQDLIDFLDIPFEHDIEGEHIDILELNFEDAPIYYKNANTY